MRCTVPNARGGRRMGMVLRHRARARGPRAPLRSLGLQRVHDETWSSSESGTDEAEQNQWNAMPSTTPSRRSFSRRQDSTAWQRCPQDACLRVRCWPDGARTRSSTCSAEGFSAPCREERPRLLTAGAASQGSGCVSNAHRFCCEPVTGHLAL